MKLMRSTNLLIGILCFSQISLGAILYPEIGKTCPDFILNNIEYFKERSANLDKFKGKWLILECWNSYSGQDGFWQKYLLELNDIQRSYRDKVQVMLIGYTGSQYAVYRGPTIKEMKESYESERNQLKLNLPISYDSSFFDRFDISACPYIIVLDPKGCVRAICSLLRKNDFSAFLKNQDPELPKAFRTHEAGSSYNYYNNRKYPEVGKICPDYIFKNVRDYTSSELDIKILR